MTFYNTINATGDQLKLFTDKAESQEKIVEMFFRMNPKKRFTTYEVFEQLMRQGLIKRNTPESSIKRAITNNFNDGVLIKCGEMKIEKYGKPNHYYKLR